MAATTPSSAPGTLTANGGTGGSGTGGESWSKDIDNLRKEIYDYLIKTKIDIESDVNALRNEFDDFEESSEQKIEEIQKNVGEASESFSEFKSEMGKIKTNTENNRVKAIEMLGLFVALFTFISVEFTLLKNASPILIVSLTAILVASLLLFVLLMDYLLSSYISGDKRRGESQAAELRSFRMKLMTFVAILYVFGLGLSFLSVHDRNQENINLDVKKEILFEKR